MAKSIYTVKEQPPNEAMLAADLGGADILWNALVEYAKSIFPGMQQEWKYYGKHGAGRCF